MIKNNNNNNSIETRYEEENIKFDRDGNIFDDKNYLMQILHRNLYKN